MKRTISIKLDLNTEQKNILVEIQHAFSAVCNQIVPYVIKNRCWNRVALHHLSYYPIKKVTDLGSQMICIAIKSVCAAYKTLGIKRNDEIPTILFKPRSIHYDKRTYSFKNNLLSLYTLHGRIKIKMILGEFQRKYIAQGIPKEAELVHKRTGWFFNLVLDLPDVNIVGGSAIGVDLGENNIATTNTGKVLSGNKLCYDRDKYLSLRKRLQSNGSRSAKQLLRKISGKEQRHVKHINHEISKVIVAEAVKTNAGVIVLENLKNIRKRIKGNKRIRSRLHRWAWRQLQDFIQYKAEAFGIEVKYVNPAYTSQICSICGNIGSRIKHQFSCLCGNLDHADINASKNLSKLATSIGMATGTVTCPNVPALAENKTVCFS